ncbi:MAG: CHAT domain-containing tetratricopeptide repeat protein [Chitinophagaceae bacterium]
MYKCLLLLLLFSIQLVFSSTAQCVDKAFLWNRLEFLRDSQPLSTREELKELLNYEVGIIKCPYKNDSTHALLLQRIGSIYSEQGDQLQGIVYTKNAIRILTENTGKSSINSSHLIRNYFNLASIYGKLNRVKEKRMCYDSCISTARKLQIVELYSLFALLEKVKHYYDLGDYELCLKFAHYGQYLSHQYVPDKAMEAYGDSTAYSNHFFLSIVNSFLAMKNYNEAEAILVARIAECKKTYSISFLGSLYEQLAKTQVEKKNYKDVIAYLKQALNYNKRIKDTNSCIGNIDNLGYYSYTIFKDYKLALFYYRKALQLRNDSQDDYKTSLNIYNHIANVYVSIERYDSARHYFQCAFDQIRKGTNEDEIVNSPLEMFIQKQEAGYLVNLFADKGDACLKEYKTTGRKTALKEAIKIYKSADILLDRIKTSQSEFRSKLFWRKNTHRLYEQAIEACILSGNADDAFLFFERSRAILLYDQLNEQRWLGEKEIYRQNQLAIELNQAEYQLNQTNLSARHYAELQGKWSNLKENQLQLQESIKEKNSLYYQSFLDSTFTTLRDIRKNLLKDHQALVELFAGDSAVYTMIVTGEKTHFSTINKKTYDSTVNKCITYISDPVLLNRQFDSFILCSRLLYKLIFQETEMPIGRIIISPDGRYFPFEVLVTEMAGSEPVYFLKDHAVSYTYSARYLMNRFTRPSQSVAGNFMGIAPVNFPAGINLAALPGSNASVERLGSFFDAADNLLESKATRSEFLNKFGKYQIIQIYTHSSANSTRGEPVIYFADQPMYLSDLTISRQPVTNLIVLSACETGNGTFYQGEGVFSFNRAFAALGIPSCINNLWSVDNESTYRLTEMFYRYLADGLPIDQALQSAKLEFMKTTSERGRLPYYWAAAILAGKTDAVEFKKKRSGGWIILLVVIGCLVVYGTGRFLSTKAKNNHKII